MRTAEEVAGNVRGALARRQKTQAQVAEQMGMSKDSFSRRVNGKHPFDVAELERLSEILDVPYAQLAGVQSA